jgi:hypothetical protein
MSNNEIEEAKTVIENIAKGINPVTGEQIEENSFLNDARIVRSFYYLVKILDTANRGSNSSKEFIITPEQKSMIVFPQRKIGVNEFSRCMNNVLNVNLSKKVTGVEINKKLKQLGILSEENTQNGKMRTIINEKSIDYGFESEKRSYGGQDYHMVVINDDGKKFLLENIEMLMQK